MEPRGRNRWQRLLLLPTPNGIFKPKPLPPLATGCGQEPMVRRTRLARRSGTTSTSPPHPVLQTSPHRPGRHHREPPATAHRGYRRTVATTSSSAPATVQATKTTTPSRSTGSTPATEVKQLQTESPGFAPAGLSGRRYLGHGRTPPNGSDDKLIELGVGRGTNTRDAATTHLVRRGSTVRVR